MQGVMLGGGLKVHLGYLYRYEQGKGENRYHDLQVHQSILIHSNIWVLFPSKQETQQQDVPDRGGPGLNLWLHHRLPLPEPWA